MNAKKTQVYYKKNKTVRFFLTNMIIVCFLLIIQFALLGLLFTAIAFNRGRSAAYAVANLAGYLISLVVVLFLINRRCNVAFKLAWVVPILLFPGAGGVLYLIVRSGTLHRRVKKRMEKSNEMLDRAEPQDAREFPRGHLYARAPRFLENRGFRAYADTHAQFLSTGEEFFEKLLEELKKAEEFIFMEFFIIHDGEMWESVLDVLKEKAQNGVKVRLMYDGMGSVKTLPGGYAKRLASFGIEAKVFGPFVPVISSTQNNRDHRKIVVIDGKAGFTGGINLADEYINLASRFGHWKDSGIFIEGPGVQSLTRFFLEMWNSKTIEDESPAPFYRAIRRGGAAGYVVPYTDSPIFETENAKSVYLEMISGAKDYIYITTPYLVPGDDVLDALKRAARAGVDVRIITPFHEDKKAVHVISRSYYRELIEAGVRIFEYTPGFIHSKTLVSDDRICSVGSSNLDYRSLYLHYECGVLCVDTPAVDEVKRDFLKTEDKCAEMRLENLKRPRAPARMYISIMRLFEPVI